MGVQELVERLGSLVAAGWHWSVFHYYNRIVMAGDFIKKRGLLRSQCWETESPSLVQSLVRGCPCLCHIADDIIVEACDRMSSHSGQEVRERDKEMTYLFTYICGIEV
jgi:hypothetical protein